MTQREGSLALGVDIGGSGIKGALVDLTSGKLASERHKIPTPSESTPQAVADTVGAIRDHFDWHGPVGITLPSVVKNQVVHSAANIHKSWIGVDATQLFTQSLDVERLAVLNDADAAGLAEIAFGNADSLDGTTIFLTFGTGIGSAVFLNGHLLPNTEFGHLYVDGVEAEAHASSAAKDREELSYEDWARRVQRVLEEYHTLFNPSRFIVGGGISKDHEKWVPHLQLDVPVTVAALQNDAGIIGAAMAVGEQVRP